MPLPRSLHSVFLTQYYTHWHRGVLFASCQVIIDIFLAGLVSSVTIDGLLITSPTSGLLVIPCVSASTLAISVSSKVILSGCLVILTPSGVNVDAWHSGIYESVQVRSPSSP